MELLRRLQAGLRVVALRAGLGVRRGWSLWRRTTGSLAKSRTGLAVLVAETMPARWAAGGFVVAVVRSAVRRG